MAVHPPQRVLVCGHRSFAANGLLDLLASNGHKAVGFTRGPLGASGDTITGPVERIHENPHLAGEFDVVINYILLKDDSIERNNEYLASLLKFCQEHRVRHLVHISSISSFKVDASLVNEDTPTEAEPDRKGAYGKLKVATDLYLIANAPRSLPMTFLRPGFIFAPGLANPIIGMAARLPYNRLLLLGDSLNRVPTTTRPLVNQAVARVVDLPPPTTSPDVLVIADTNSPPRKEYLRAACDLCGFGKGVVTLPVWFWLLIGAGGAVVARVLGMKLRPFKIIRGVCRRQRFDSTKTSTRLGLDLSVDWRKALVDSQEGQQPDWTAPHRVVNPAPTGAKRINIIGFGAIIKQKHLPSLKKLAFGGQIGAYDLAAKTDQDSGIRVEAISAGPIPSADLHIVATPGLVHNKAIPLLKDVAGAILVEKPLCYTPAELDEWLAFARTRRDPVLVLHNYRYKANVCLMLEHLARYNPGRLRRVEVDFQSPPVAHDGSWRRDERRARTLLMDYSLHFLDLACMFQAGPWTPVAIRHELNALHHTSFIEGQLNSATYNVAFMLRQGIMPRRCRIFYTFENYGMSLAFFPDTFVPHMSFDNWALYKMEAKQNFRVTARKVVDKFTSRDSDRSHALAIAGALGEKALATSMELPHLENFYRAVFKVADQVYSA